MNQIISNLSLTHLFNGINFQLDYMPLKLFN